jgi:hypothetical protein
MRRISGAPLALGLPYPHRLGAWPAVALFGAFAWVELVYTGRTLPFHLALTILAYSVVN